MSGGDSKAIHFEELRERLAECGVIVNQQDPKRSDMGAGTKSIKRGNMGIECKEFVARCWR